MLRITTVSGKVLPLVFNIVHYKLGITTASVYLCVQILSAHPLRSISGCSSGIVIVPPSQASLEDKILYNAVIGSVWVSKIKDERGVGLGQCMGYELGC